MTDADLLHPLSIQSVDLFGTRYTIKDWLAASAPRRSQAGELLRDHATDMAIIRRQAERAFEARTRGGQ